VIVEFVEVKATDMPISAYSFTGYVRHRLMSLWTTLDS